VFDLVVPCAEWALDTSSPVLNVWRDSKRRLQVLTRRNLHCDQRFAGTRRARRTTFHETPEEMPAVRVVELQVLVAERHPWLVPIECRCARAVRCPPVKNTVLSLETLVPAAFPRFVPTDDDNSGATPPGFIAHLDAVYALALALTSQRDRAEELTERVYRDVTREVWSTLGGHSLRNRLLARCLTIFDEQSRQTSPSAANPRADVTDMHALLATLPRDERAAVSLVDQLGLSYADGAVVFGSTVSEFRTILHRGRNILMTAIRSATAL